MYISAVALMTLIAHVSMLLPWELMTQHMKVHSSHLVSERWDSSSQSGRHCLLCYILLAMGTHVSQGYISISRGCFLV